jgi:cytochrome c biogenesis protein CcmG, thiol:disulfide interchange protein DsbE
MKKRSVIVLGVAAALAGGIYLSKAAIQRGVYKWSLYHDDAPSDVAFNEVLEHSSDPLPIVQDLWKRDRVALRIGVMHYLRRHATEGSPLWPSTRSIVLEAARCGDIEAAENALTVLENNHDGQGLAVALAMLHDLDPELRQYALLYLGRSGGKTLVPRYMKMLDDPEPKVRSIASNNLSEITGQEINVHYDADETTKADGIAAWKKWWDTHKAEYASSGASDSATRGPEEAAQTAAVPATEFALQDLSGKTVKLSDFRGKPVLINFWATWCPSCVKEIPDLMELRKHRPGLVVLGVCLDKVPDADGDDAPDTTKGDFAANIRQYSQEHQITYPVLLDHDGKWMAPYGGGDLPVSVLVDAQGNVRRRVLGARTMSAWEAMVDGIAPRGPEKVASR